MSFRKREQLCCLLLTVAMGATLTRTVQLPNDWAEAHWLLDYRFGYVKRGLPGQLLAWATDLLGITIDANVIASVALVLCGCFCTLLFLIAIHVVRRSGWDAGVTAATVAFLTSPFLVMTGHVVGYLDHVFLSLGVASIWCVTRERWWAASLLQTIAMFVHESSILLTWPSFVLVCLLRAAADRNERQSNAPLPILPLLLPLLTAGLLTCVVPRVPTDFYASFTTHLKGFPFVRDGFDWMSGAMLAGSLSEAFSLMGPRLGENMAKPSSIGLVVPTMLSLLLFVLARARLAVLSLESVAVAVVVLVPQTLHLVAWDLERLWTYSILLMFLVLWIYVDREEATEPKPRGTFVVPFFAVCCNLAMETPLMGHAEDRTSRKVRAVILLVLVVGLLGLAITQSPVPWRERLRWRGRSVRDLLRR